MTFASRTFSKGDEHRSSYVGLNDDDAALMKTLGFAAKRYPADAVIFSQGDSNDRIYIVESGWGCISHELPGGTATNSRFCSHWRCGSASIVWRRHCRNFRGSDRSLVARGTHKDIDARRYEIASLVLVHR